MSDLVFNESLGRKMRSGSGSQLGVPTDRLATDALRAGDDRAARELLDYLVAEAGRIFRLYSTWFESLVPYCEEHLADFATHRARLTEVIGVPTPVTADEDAVAPDERARAAEAVDRRDPDAFEAALRQLRQAHWDLHDAQTDWAWGLLTVLQEELGEERMEEVFRETQGSWLADRYATAGKLTPEELYALTIEGMRGHYCGSGRTGDIQVTEDDEKWVMSFDPCGTGGRMRRGDPDRAQVPRTEPPFSFAHVEGAYDWTWNREGVCLYCAHCAVVNEIIPIEQLGTPMRVTDYPESPDQPCRWTVYKSPDLVPDAVFERVGKRRPAKEVDEQQ